MLEIKNLKAEINNKKIIKGLNLKINQGEVHAIMGPNGSGKSTLLGLISGIYFPSVGDINVFSDKFGFIGFNNLLKLILSKNIRTNYITWYIFKRPRLNYIVICF